MESELDSLARGTAGVRLALFGIAVGAALTSLATIATAPHDAVLTPSFVAVLVISIFASAFFGFSAWQDWQTAHDLVREIKRPERETPIDNVPRE